VLAVTAVGGALALSAGRGWGTLWVVSAVLAGQLFVGWTNDYLDRDLDRAKGRRDKPLAQAALKPEWVRTAALVALAACLPLSLASGLAAAGVHLAAIGAATLYNLGLKATLLSVVPYAAAFSLLPAFITLGLDPSRWAPAWAVAAGGLIGAGAHFTQVLTDPAGLPQKLGRRGSALAAALLYASAALLIGSPLLALAVAFAVGLTALLAPGQAFRVAMVAAGAVVVLFLAGGTRL